MTVQEAYNAGHPRLRHPGWIADAYLLFLKDECRPPVYLARLYCPYGQPALCQAIGSQTVELLPDGDSKYEPFTGEPSPYEPGEGPPHVHSPSLCTHDTRGTQETE